MPVAPRGASAWPSERLLRASSRPHRAVIERLQRSADFERVLRTATRARSVHFAAHHLGDVPSLVVWRRKPGSRPELSTSEALVEPQAVDESAPIAVGAESARQTQPTALWLGAVVPKRHARRSVTRSLIKRQIRAAVARQAHTLARGLWVIRLRAPFDPGQFPSAGSQALRVAAHDELAQLLVSATQRRTVR